MLLSTLKFLFIIVEVLLIFNLLIVVHELGHFLAARWRGLVIEGFGIWFGKPIWKKRIGGVDFSLGCIPAGGFVKLPQMAPMEAIEGKSEGDRASLPPVSPLDKIIVAFAGPLFSMGLALAFAVIVWIVGRPVSESQATTTIGYILPSSPAEKAGMQVGDKILEVDGHPVHTFGGMGDSVSWRVVRSEGKTIPFKIERDGKILNLEAMPVIPPTKGWGRAGLRQVQIEPAETPMIARVAPGSTAERAGLKPNDLITAVDGRKLYHLGGLIEAQKQRPDQALQLTVQRGDQTKSISYLPEGAEVEKIIADGPAAEAGIRAGDLVTSVNGRRVNHAAYVTDFIEKHGGQPLTLGIRRGSEQLEVKLTPQVPLNDTKPRIGLAWSQEGITWDQTGKYHLVYPHPIEQVASSVRNMVNTIGALLSPKSDVKPQHMSGPVMIFRIYYVLFESEQGWRMVLWFSVFLNVNLALLNMLPIPVLDGGHILLALIEAVRRRPANVKVLEIVQSACALLLIGYMLYVTFYDVLDLPWRKRDEMKFAPSPAPAGE
jgi:regulator of sigma E protease